VLIYIYIYIYIWTDTYTAGASRYVLGGITRSFTTSMIPRKQWGQIQLRWVLLGGWAFTPAFYDPRVQKWKVQRLFLFLSFHDLHPSMDDIVRKNNWEWWIALLYFDGPWSTMSSFHLNLNINCQVVCFGGFLPIKWMILCHFSKLQIPSSTLYSFVRTN
jgi:hypothetical protein